MTAETRPDLSTFFEVQLALDAPRGLGAMMNGGNPKVKRQALDFYPTPADVTRAFLRAERDHLQAGSLIWEPCGRGGAIMRELSAAGFQTIGTDLVPDPTHKVHALDVLEAKRPRAARAVTNPPFAIAAEIILHLLDRLEVEYLGLLLKGSFWHAEERRALFEQFPPARIHALTWRPDFLGGGAPTMECAWTVWERPHTGPTTYHLLPRQEPQERLL